MIRRAQPWDDLPQAKSNPVPTARIQGWRDREYKAGRPSGLLDYYRVHSVCVACQGTGIKQTPTGWAGEVPLFNPCETCGGTGKVKVS